MIAIAGVVLGVLALAATVCGVVVAIRNARRPQPVVVTAAAPAPYWMSLADWERRSAELRRDGWVPAAPTPEGAHAYLSHGGWVRVEVEGQPVVIGGNLERPENWGIKRRIAGYGLSENTKRIIVSALRNTTRPRTMEFRRAAYKSESHLFVTDPHHGMQIDGPEAEDALRALRERGLIEHTGENYYQLTQQGRDEAQRLNEEAGL